MGRGYSVKFRQKVIGLYNSTNLSYAEVGKLFDIGEASVGRWLKLKREKNDLSPCPHSGGRQNSIQSGAQLNRLQKIIDSKPDATIAEIKIEYNKKVKNVVSDSTIQRGIKRLNYTRKKKAI